MADEGDIAADFQQKMNDNAERRTNFQKNYICSDCGDDNDQPDYAICTRCRDKRLKAMKAKWAPNLSFFNNEPRMAILP